MSKLILPVCCNSKDHPEPPSFGIPACEKGTLAPVVLNVELRHQNRGDGMNYKLCLTCPDKAETWAEEHGAYTKRLNVEPVVGMPATIGIGSDRYPAKVTKVSDSGKTITVMRVQFKAAPGHNHFGSQKYEYSDETEGGEQVWTWRQRSARWLPKGSSTRSGYGLGLGHQSAHIDPHF